MNMQVDGPRLCLRGGGASSARKEARKRRFGTTGPMSKPDAFSEHESNLETSPTKEVTPEPMDKDNHTESPAKDPQPSETKPHRFVVFVGNLPYTATDSSIQKHFANLKPTSIRHLHSKTTGKSKGFAFLEFNQYDRLKTCLKTFHQSKFDDGISPPRSLNVELTAGGGGSKSKDRRVKLKMKNEKLRQERERRALELAKTQQEKGVGGGKPVRKTAPKSTQKAVRDQSENQDVHPSRRARVGGSR
ncbi:MAG: hypothetical protein Q9213_003913 [Squamulea squamosa]